MSDQIIYFGKVVEIEDDLMLGRVRVEPLNIKLENFLNKAKKECIDESKTYANEKIIQKCRWTKDDPFVFLSLLPYYLNVTPIVDELVSIFFSSEERKFPNQFYIKGPISTPLALESEYFEASKNLLADGNRDKKRRSLKTKSKEVNQEKGKIIRPETNGIFPEPGDNAFLGRGRTDLILQKDHVLLRSGKYSNPSLSPNDTPIANQSRSFVQLSFFDTTKILEPTYVTTNFEMKVAVVKRLVEWSITNANNTANAFNGRIVMYSVKPNVKTNTNNLGKDVEIQVDQYLTKLPEYEFVFNSKPMDYIVKCINAYIKGMNDGQIDLPPFGPTPSNFSKPINESETFPFVFRPNELTYQWLKRQAQFPRQFSNIQAFYNQIIFKGKRGFGLVSSKNTVGDIFEPQIEETTPVKIVDSPQTIASVGGNKIYLLSHNTSIPGLQKIDLNNTLYGIDQNKFVYEIEPGTNSLIRGEKFIEIIQLLVRWVQTHVHPLAPTAPVDISEQGESLSEVLTLLADESAYMNKNIKIN